MLVGAIFIGVWVFDKNDGPQPVTVPNLVGEKLDVATNRAANVNLKVQQAGTERCEQPTGAICRQEPVADNVTKLEPDSTIKVFLSEGAPLVEVPDVQEQSQERATKSLEEKGFKVKVEEEESDEDPGSVLRQNPGGGTKAEKNSEVTITIAKKKLSTVPPVVGNQLAQAEQQLKALGFVVVTEDVDSDKPKGEVLEQSPEGNASVAGGSEVKLKVSKGPQQTQVTIPGDLGNRPFKDVKAQLEGMGLTVVQKGSDKEDALVFGTNPPANTPVNTGSTVEVYTAGGGLPSNPGDNNNGDNNGGNNNGNDNGGIGGWFD